MKKTSLVALCLVGLAGGALAQELDIVRTNGQVDSFVLADIDSITFGLPGKSASTTGDILRVHAGAAVQLFPVAAIDSVSFDAGSTMTIHRGSGSTSPFALADIDSLTFASFSANAVSVVYNGATATVLNPLAGAGVAVAVTGADVTITSTAGVDGIEYALSGATTDGMCKIYSDGDLTLRLDGVQITNLNGPAINIQADEEITVELPAGSVNSLTDGTTYAAAPAGEDQKAAFFSEGQLIFTGTGSLTVTGHGSSQHGLGSDDYIRIDGGTVAVASAVKDAIHTNEGYLQNAGSVTAASTGDGIDAGDGPVTVTGGSLTVTSTAADCDAVKCSGQITIDGGVVGITVAGNQSKGLNAAEVVLSGGTLNIQTSGGVVLEASGSGFDPSYCTGVKADNQVLLDGCQLTIVTTGVAGRGISCDGDIIISSGALQVTSSGGGASYTNSTGVLDAYHGPCLNADDDLVISGGTVTLSHSGSGGKGIAGDSDLTIGTALAGPVLNVATTGTRITIGGGEYAEAKAVSVDSLVTVNNGTLTISSTDDAIKSKVRIDINAGLITIPSSLEGLEAPNLYINGGELRVTSTDDGLNATYGNDIEGNDGSILNISGGTIYLNAPAGDGLDSNGNLTISGGTLIVHGPPAQPEVGLDVNGTFLVTGGLIVVAQINSMMNEVPSAASSQRSALMRTNTALAAGTLFHLETSTGTSVLTFRPARNYSAILFSGPGGLTAGTSYRIYTGGTCTGTLQDGLYTGGTYSGGTLRTTFTSTAVAQTVTF